MASIVETYLAINEESIYRVRGNYPFISGLLSHKNGTSPQRK